MPAVDLLQEWQETQAAVDAAFRAMTAKMRNGGYIHSDELALLSDLLAEARSSCSRYRKQIAIEELLKRP